MHYRTFRTLVTLLITVLAKDVYDHRVGTIFWNHTFYLIGNVSKFYDNLELLDNNAFWVVQSVNRIAIFCSNARQCGENFRKIVKNVHESYWLMILSVSLYAEEWCSSLCFGCLRQWFFEYAFRVFFSRSCLKTFVK